LRGLGELS